jgi:hypothetical protein
MLIKINRVVLYLLLFISIFFIPIRHFLVDTTLYFEFFFLILLAILLRKQRIFLSPAAKKYAVFLAVFFFISTLVEFLDTSITILEHLSITRKNGYSFLVPVLVFGLINQNPKKNLVRPLQVAFWIISLDFILSAILYHGFELSPKSYYPWYFLHASETGKIPFNGYESTRLIPTLYAFPYPHGEALLHGVLMVFVYMMKRQKLVLLIGFVAQSLVFVKTSLIALIFVFLCYFLYSNKKYFVYFLVFITVITSLNWQKVNNILLRYNYFDPEIFFKIFQLPNFIKYLNNASIAEILFGNFALVKQEIGTSEIRILVYLVQYGFIVFLLHLFIHLIPIYVNIKRYKRSGLEEYLFCSMIPVVILIDSLHYYNFFNFQNIIILVIIYLTITSDIRVFVHRPPASKTALP